MGWGGGEDKLPASLGIVHEGQVKDGEVYIIVIYNLSWESYVTSSIITNTQVGMT